MKYLSEFLSLSMELCKEAGSAILDIYAKVDIAHSMKSDNSPLTLADLASNRILYQGLSRTNIPILSEEGKKIPYEIRRDWKLFWLIDPLDGTKEFINKNGEFTVNIALIQNNSPILGIIYAPVKNLLYYAVKGEGTWKEGTGEKNRIICTRSQDDSNLKVVISRSHNSEEARHFLNSLNRYFNNISLIEAGSSLKFCLLAEGLAHLYPRFGPTMEWDTAAGQIILEEAKGTVLELETYKPLQYNKRSLTNPYFLALSNLDKSFLSGVFK